MEHNGFPKREGTRTVRVVNWAQVSILYFFFSFFMEKNEF